MPIGGLNARDAIAAMPATDALTLDNIVPNTTDCSLRLGYRSYATGLPGDVETLLPYRSGTGNKMFAVSDGKIYDATSLGPVGAAVVSGLTNSRFQHVNFGTPGGQFMLAVNNADPLQRYNGTAWSIGGLGTGAVITTITFVGTTATLTTATPHGLGTGNTVTVSGAAPAQYNVTNAPITIVNATRFTYVMGGVPATNATVVGSYAYSGSITGFDTRNAFAINVFGNRVWLVERNSFSVWYLALNSISGAATKLDLSSLFVLGGSLAGMITWTTASSVDTQQYAAFVSTEGEVVIYKGYDPASADTWALAGQARIGRPVGDRFWTRVGTDVVLICADGFVALSSVLQIDRQRRTDAVSSKIIRAATEAVALYGNSFGWEVNLYPTGSKLIINVPATEATYQFVMNTDTGAWCRYTGIAAFTWESTQDDIFFGGAGVVYQAEYGNDDDGDAIYGVVKPAFNYFGDKVISKFFQQVRPTIIAAGPVNLALDLTVNFQDSAPVSTPSLTTATTLSMWDVAVWDISLWSLPSTTYSNWEWVGGIGFAASARLQVNTRGVPVSFEAMDYTFELSDTIF